MTGDLKPYERLKLFILNLGHTYLAEIWARDGGAPTLTVREAMADKATRAELDQLFDEEVLPVFAGIGMKEEAEAYRATVIERFCNPFLDHRLAEIFINHEAKKQRRFGGLIELADGATIFRSSSRGSEPRLLPKSEIAYPILDDLAVIQTKHPPGDRRCKWRRERTCSHQRRKPHEDNAYRRGRRHGRRAQRADLRR